MQFGPHLMLDLKSCNPAKLSNLELIFTILNDLPDAIHMHKITQPYVFPYSGLVPEDKGITGFVVIAESHISIHTFQEKNYAFVDIFSCKDFDCNTAARYVIEMLESDKPEISIVQRGIGFPRDYEKNSFEDCCLQTSF